MNIEALTLTEADFAHTQILDDNPSVTFVISKLLQKSNYVNFSIHNTVRSFFSKFSPKTDLVVLDCYLPNPIGLSILAQIKKINPFCLVIMISDAEEKYMAIRSLNLGAWKYCDKSDKNFYKNVKAFLFEGQLMIKKRNEERQENEEIIAEMRSYIDNKLTPKEDEAGSSNDA